MVTICVICIARTTASPQNDPKGRRISTDQKAENLSLN